MDVFNLIYKALQIIYVIIPKELFIVILGSIIVGIYYSFKERNEKKTKSH
jgi:hypothetical protein|tara:strand:+ start:431 stop:580 length:150 start_codon:yes stop_codon:yes gene_type:complete